MAISEASYLETLWAGNICPYCHNSIPEGKRVGSGKRSNGGFCSLNCFSRYHALDFAEKATILKRSRPPQNEQ